MNSAKKELRGLFFSSFERILVYMECIYLIICAVHLTQPKKEIQLSIDTNKSLHIRVFVTFVFTMFGNTIF